VSKILNNKDLWKLSLHDIMMRDEVKIRLREMMNARGKIYKIPPGFFDLNNLRCLPGYIQNFMWSFRDSKQEALDDKILVSPTSRSCGLEIDYILSQSSFQSPFT